MEEAETVSIMSRKELRKLKFMEYLAAKAKLEKPKPKPGLRDNNHREKPVVSTLKVMKEKENKPPAAERQRYERSKGPTLSAQSTKQPDRKAFGVTQKVNTNGSAITGRLSRPSATSGPARPKLNQNPALRETYTVVSSRPTLSSASHLMKQPNKGIQSSGRASSNTAHTKTNSRFGSSSNAAWARPTKTVSTRMSLGPLVKTKTGLVPAAIQPRNGQNVTHTNSNTTASLSNKVQPVSQGYKVTQRRTLPATALNKPVNMRISVSSTVRAGVKVHEQHRNNSKLNLMKPSQLPSKSQQSGLKSTRTAAPAKSEGRVGISKTSEGEREKNCQSFKVTSRTSSGPAGRSSSITVSRVTQAAGAELKGKTKIRKETENKKGHSSANPPPLQKTVKRTGAPVRSQTVPQPARTVSLTGQKTDAKVPVKTIPQTEGKKLTAVQEERMKKLQEWREARGISYKRPPMQVKPQVRRRTVAVPQPFWVAMKEEDDAHSLISAVDSSLADCIKLLEEGCSPDQVKEVLSRLPTVSKKFAKYWICQARLMEQEGNLDVLPMFEEAVGIVLEPVDELRTVVFDILKKKDETQESEKEEEDQAAAEEGTPESTNDPMMTPKPIRALICGEKGNSSVVKYKITATPGGPPSQKKEPTRVNGQEVRFFTPVRRSVRIERASLRYPASLQDHDLCVASYNDLISEEDAERPEGQRDGETSSSADSTPMYVYRQNEALNDKVSVQLVYDEGV